MCIKITAVCISHIKKRKGEERRGEEEGKERKKERKGKGRGNGVDSRTKSKENAF